ncbi:xylulose kinase, partial [bacterium]|nr:xylulose kinase [bacterium]
MPRLSLGLDSSTQGLAAVAVDLDSRETVWEHALDYRGDSRLDRFGLAADYLLPPTEPGEANQPAALYFASLEAVFDDLVAAFRERGLSPRDIRVINVSGQQHGFVLLNAQAEGFFGALALGAVQSSLPEHLAGALATPEARIWRTACTGEEAAFVRSQVGGKDRIVELSGSDAPLRFSAFGIRRTALRRPAVYAQTALIHQISSLVPAVLTGRVAIPLDWGNACGSSLMDYRARAWSAELLAAVAGDLPGGAAGLRGRLPGLGSALELAGPLARHFTERWGLDPACLVGVGSGDNPQSKVLIQGSLL